MFLVTISDCVELVVILKLPSSSPLNSSKSLQFHVGGLFSEDVLFELVSISSSIIRLSNSLGVIIHSFVPVAKSAFTDINLVWFGILIREFNEFLLSIEPSYNNL